MASNITIFVTKYTVIYQNQIKIEESARSKEKLLKVISLKVVMLENKPTKINLIVNETNLKTHTNTSLRPWAYTKHFFTRAEEFSILINLLIGSIQKLKIPFTSLLLHQFWILIKQF